MLNKLFNRLGILVLNITILVISFLIPKTDRIIIVGGWFGKRFADNSKSFYLYANANKEKLNLDNVIWITSSNEVFVELSNEGFEVYKTWSFKSMWYHLRANFHLIDQSMNDINPYFSVRSKKINLWHGFPLKKIGTYKSSSKNINKLGKYKKFVSLSGAAVPGFWGKQYLLTTSEYSAEILGNAFNLPKDKVIISGYPRNYEPLLENTIKFISNNEKPFFEKIEEDRASGFKIIGYFPTFRDNKETLIFGTNNSNELKELLDFFHHMKIKVVGKFHFSAGENVSIDTTHEAFINLPPDVDLYTFLNQIDILITDYSSIYFDYLLWKRPIIFFPYDLEYYQTEDRGLIFDYEEYTPGPKVLNINELKSLFTVGYKEFLRNYKSNYQGGADKLETKIFGNAHEMTIEHLAKQLSQI
jgi:CDP-glycerol glycerophosphotransferase (TagB/SpsB family)